MAAIAEPLNNVDNTVASTNLVVFILLFPFYCLTVCKLANAMPKKKNNANFFQLIDFYGFNHLV